jgi:hypothetical protein
MITKKEYLEAKMIIELYENQNNYEKIMPPKPQPPLTRYIKEGRSPEKPKRF